MTDGEGTMSYVFDANRRLQSETRTFTGLAGKFYKLTYSYAEGGQLKTVNYNAATSQSEAVPTTAPKQEIAPQVARLDRALPRQRFPYKTNAPWFAPLLRNSGQDLWLVNPNRFLRATAKPGTTLGQNRAATFSGYVRRPASQGGTPLANVEVNYQRVAGSADPWYGSVFTDTNGYYSITNLGQDNYYWIFPSLSGWIFTPEGTYWSVGIYDETQDFTGTWTNPTTTISGQVVNGAGQGVSGVTMTLSGGMNQTTTTDTTGNYTFTVNKEQNYTVTPSKSGWTFSPTSRSYTNVTTPQTGNYVGTQTNPPPPPTGNGPQTFSYNVNYAYNANGALTGVGTNLMGSDPNATTNVLSGINYNGFGAVTTLNYGNGRRLSLSYNVQRHQMLTMKVDNQNGTDMIVNKSYSYTYTPTSLDNDGRIKKITDHLDGNYTTTYSYDMYNRLTSANSTAANRSYTYDEWGNVKTVVGNSGTTTYTLPNNASGAPATNRMSSVTAPIVGTVNYTWDAAGNMTGEGATTYQYDAGGRMVSVNGGTSGSYGFDGDGKRVKKTEGGVSLYSVRSSLIGDVAFEVTGSQGNLNRANVYQGRVLIAQLSIDGNFYWVHKDHRNNAHKMTNTSGAVVYRGEFEPHGNSLLETGSVNLTNRKFTGHERDASGLDYANARMFTGARGRFTSPDPAGMQAANKALPQTLNRYAYVNNDPVNFADLTGKSFIDLRFFLQSACGGGYGAIYSDAFLSSGKIYCIEQRELFSKKILMELGEYTRGGGRQQSAEPSGIKIKITDLQNVVGQKFTWPNSHNTKDDPVFWGIGRMVAVSLAGENCAAFTEKGWTLKELIYFYSAKDDYSKALALTIVKKTYPAVDPESDGTFSDKYAFGAFDEKTYNEQYKNLKPFEYILEQVYLAISPLGREVVVAINQITFTNNNISPDFGATRESVDGKYSGGTYCPR